MALGRRCRESEVVGFGAVHATRGLGRKRIGISKDVKQGAESSFEEFKSPLKRQCSDKFDSEMETGIEIESSPLENLPQELLIRVLCGVEHSDLRQLMCVSKSVMEATLMAKSEHFAYSTPSKVKAFRELKDLSEEIEAPNAPRLDRKGSRLFGISQKAKEDLTVALFQSDDDDNKWPRRVLSFMDEDEC